MVPRSTVTADSVPRQPLCRFTISRTPPFRLWVSLTYHAVGTLSREAGFPLSRTHVDTRGYPRRPGLQARLTVIMIYVSNTGCMIFTHQGPNSAPLRHHGAIEPSDPLGYLLLLPSEARVRLTSGAS
jgi:hypothetical protein